jgi:DNA end-binding protein Ku
VSFGLLNIPVAVYPGEQRSELRFHLLDSRNKARVRYARLNEETGEEVPWNEIVKAYEFDGGDFVPVTDEDFRRAKPEATQTVEIQGFVEEGDIDRRFWDTPYLLEPGKRGEKGYVLLREALKRTGRIAVGKVVIRTREYLAAVVPQGDALVLELLRYPQELRDPGELKLPSGDLADYKISDKELDMAETLVQAMAMQWEPSRFHDEYREKLLAWIREKAAAGGRVPAAPEPAGEAVPAGKVIDMMDLLQKSLERSRQQAPEQGKKEPRRKSARSAKTANASRSGKDAARRAG